MAFSFAQRVGHRLSDLYGSRLSYDNSKQPHTLVVLPLVPAVPPLQVRFNGVCEWGGMAASVSGVSFRSVELLIRSFCQAAVPSDYREILDEGTGGHRTEKTYEPPIFTMSPD